MAIDVEELVIQPFREVVEHGREAVANAEATAGAGPDENDVESTSQQNATDMLKAARSLVKEGERALQRLLPLWKERVDKYGDAFTEAMRQNDKILDSQRRLEDLLYDLDDFVHVDSFDPAKFAEVQASSKSFALTLMETIKRLHIDESAPSTSSVPSVIQPLSPRGLNIAGHSNTGTVTPGNAGLSGTNTPVRRSSSPDILGAERDFISLVSGPPAVPPANSRTTAWVSEQTTAKPWPHKNSIPENDFYVAQPAILNNLDSVTLRGQEAPVPPNVNSPGTSFSRVSWYTSTGSFASGPRSSVHVPTSDQRTTSLAKTSTGPHEAHEPREPESPSLPSSPPVPRVTPTPSPQVYEDGLIPAEELFRPDTNSSSGYQIGLDSSLYLQKGFCSGAQTFRLKGRKSATRAVMEYGTRRSIARCTECEFAQSLLDVELDDGQDSSGNFSKAGILYRLRFLYKSHLISGSAFTMQFGCLFCAQKGRTVSVDDATVFTTQDQLFRHLAHHPQPLPIVPGITIIYGQVSKDDPNVEDYDIHLPHPPVESLLPDAATLAKLPSAVATKAHVKKYGRDLTDPDGSSDQVLKFVEGARIVGIEFPEKWKGKWCTGWHDGQWGSLPIKHISLEPPAHSPGISTGGNGMFVTTRWKWDMKDNSAVGWLPLDKDETLSRVSWLNQDDWCWSGMKKNGKVGLFPRSHVVMESLRGTAVWNAGGSEEELPKPKKQGGFGLPTLNMRRMTIGSSGS
ncbi:hypothetical protein GGS26DRAFT_576135 [Hypomontagnella submonticulosa]|nr:hypothetical protein GGS26DRAFT_576135 [Hypomontagnella submonticulosa]